MDKAVIEKFGIISENAAGAVVFQNFVVNTHGSSKIAAEMLVQGVIDRLQSILDELRNKRKAIDEGMNNTPVFPENIKYLEELRRKS